MKVEIHPVEGLPEVEPGDDLVDMLANAIRQTVDALLDKDVVVVTHKIVSKAEGRVVTAGGDDDYRRIAEAEAAQILRRRGDLIITRTTHGFVCANGGVDRSNTAAGTAVLLPADPDRSAHSIRKGLEREFAVGIGVVITDTFGRAWRRGQTDVAIGVSGLVAVDDLRGGVDHFGRTLTATEIAVADEIAAAADLAMGKADRIPAAIVRGLDVAGPGRASDLIRLPAEDLFL